MYKKMWKKFYRAARIWNNKGIIYEEDAKDLYVVEYNLGRAVWSYGKHPDILMVFAWKDNKAINVGWTQHVEIREG